MVAVTERELGYDEVVAVLMAELIRQSL